MGDGTYVINEVRASVCNPSARRESSRYLGTLLIGIRTELEGLMLELAGSNLSTIGDDGRVEGGVMFAEILGFVLDKYVRIQ
jgi:hypothetical protein